MTDIIEIAAVPVIVTAVYWAINLYKKVTKEQEKFLKFIPLIAAGLGVILGIAAYFAMPAIIPADNVFVAILIGGASGLAATGTNQVFKQLGKKGNGEDDKGGK